MHLEPGQTVVWEKVSATECRLIVLLPEQVKPDPLAALRFARENGLEEGSSDAWMAELREGEED
jgi:hypothetical protein